MVILSPHFKVCYNDYIYLYALLIYNVSNKTMHNSSLKKLQAYMDLGRVQGVSITAAVSILGAYSSTNTPSLVNWLEFTAIAAFCHAGGAAMNEYCDKELDSKLPELSNKPLVKGILSNNEALCFSLFMIFAGIISAVYFFPKQSALIVLLLSIATVYAYDLIGKRRFLAFEITFPIGYALYSLFGVYAIGEPTALSWIVIVYVFLALVFGQWENEMKDADNDRFLGIPSIAAVSGYSMHKKLTLGDPNLVYGVGVKLLSYAVLFFPFLLGVVTSDYLYIFFIVGVPTQAYVIYHLFGEHTRKDFVKIILVDVAVTWILGASLVIDEAGARGVIALVLFVIVGYMIGSFLQRGAEFKLGGAKSYE